MSRYLLFNLLLGTGALSAMVVLVRSRSEVRVVLQTALTITALAYPWGFLAITLGAWGYPHDPGWRLYAVPVNDLLLAFSCSIGGASAFVAVRRRRKRERKPEQEHDGHEPPDSKPLRITISKVCQDDRAAWDGSPALHTDVGHEQQRGRDAQQRHLDADRGPV